jgi:hypothetical protein
VIPIYDTVVHHHIREMNSAGTWSTVATNITSDVVYLPGLSDVGYFRNTVTRSATGVYTFRVTYDGDSQYAPAVSNTVTLTATNVAVS